MPRPLVGRGRQRLSVGALADFDAAATPAAGRIYGASQTSSRKLSAHKTSLSVPGSLAHKKRAAGACTSPQTSSPWLDLVECWFYLLSRKAFTNTSITSVAEPKTMIDCRVSHRNDSPGPSFGPKLPTRSSTSRPRTSHPSTESPNPPQPRVSEDGLEPLTPRLWSREVICFGLRLCECSATKRA
jgi:hypothetical protein